MFNIHSRLGQMTTEFMVLWIIVVLVLLSAGGGYFKHSVMGRIRESARDIGESGLSGIEQPYYPRGTTGNTTHFWRDQTVTQIVPYGLDEGGNVTSSNPYEASGVALTTGTFRYTVNVTENMGSK